MLTGLDLPGRAALLGLSCREYLALAKSDRRIFTSPSLDAAGSVTRMRRWIDAGMPEPNLGRLEFGGDDGVRDVVSELLRCVPKPVAWHGIEFVLWFEVGRSACGWQGLAPMPRAPEGDQAQVILLDGRASDEAVISTASHELGHAWSSAVFSLGPRCVRMPDDEMFARHIAAERVVMGGQDLSADQALDRVVRARLASEVLADALSTLWGYPRCTDGAWLRRTFAARAAAVAARADEIFRNTEDAENEISNAG